MAKPAFVPPMLATLVGAPFDDPDWLFEVKWDGFRVEAIVDGGATSLRTRGEKDAAQFYFGPFLDPPTWISAKEAIVDGEVIALDDRGEPDFALLQARIKGRATAAAEPTPFVYEVFDLLHLEGRSLLDEPLEERRRLLASVLRPDPRVRLSEHVEGDGLAFFEAARVRGLEGVMAKDRRSRMSRASARTAGRRSRSARAGARRRRLGDGHRQGGRPGRAARRRVRGRWPALRGKVGAGFTDSSGRTCWPRSRSSPPTRRRSTTRCPGPPPATPTGSARSSSSARSSPVGPATASSGRPRTRASNRRRSPRKVIRERPKA
jgi:hypothetical protein